MLLMSQRARPVPRICGWAVLAAVLAGTGPADAWARPAPKGGWSAATECGSSSYPELATRIATDVRAALQGRTGTVSIAVSAPGRGLTCRLSSSLQYDAASIAKVVILEGLLYRANQSEGRGLTAEEARLARAMITRSDNASASSLWRSLGRDRLNAVLRRAGTEDTVLGRDGYWGLTRTSARDQLKVLDAVSRRPYAMELMNEVIAGQDWGVSAGAPDDVTIHLKNGWLPRATHGWRVHSIGTFTGAGRDYRMALLSHDNASQKYGVRTLERIATAVHRSLGDSKAAVRGYTPESEISEIPDGSVP
ncbi:serine hydrolase [Streptomyces sp. NPDC055749]